jgi:hypothetical protein
MTNIYDDETLINYCSQRKRRQLLFIPKSRNELISPYENTSLTKTQLDMRRKVEILKYSNNKSNNKINNDTQKQLWKKLVQNITTKQNYGRIFQYFYNRNLDIYQSYLKKSFIDYSCPLDRTPRPSSNSDVPGSMLLYEDPTIPLYNYKIYNNYGILNDVNDYNILVNSNTNFFVPDHTNTFVYYLYSEKPIDKLGNFTFNIPISLYVNGIVNNSSLSYGDHLSFTGPNSPSFTIKDIKCDVYYKYNVSDEEIHKHIVSPDVTLESQRIVMDVSFTYTENVTSFTGIHYLQNIVVGPFDLNTEGQLIYDIHFTINIDETINALSTDFTTSYGILVNVEDSQTTSENCNFDSINPNLSNTFQEYSVDGFDSSKKTSQIVDTYYYNKEYEYTLITPDETPANIDVSQNICLSQYVYVDVNKYYNPDLLAYQNVYILKNTVFENNVFNVADVLYNPLVYYKLKIGTYYLVNIPKTHPIAILNSNNYIPINGEDNYNILYENNNNYGYTGYTSNYTRYENETYQIGPETVDLGVGDPENGDYIFMYGSIKIDVIRDFDKVSIYCYNHGFMGNRYLLQYDDGTTC